jgi:hypothetical protein
MLMGWQARLKVDYSVEDQRCVARQRICSIGREAGLSKRLNRKDPISQAKLDTRQGADVPGQYRWFEAAPQTMPGYRLERNRPSTKKSTIKIELES